MISAFDTIDELWLYAADLILKYGHDCPSRDGASREIMGFAARLNNPMAHFLFNPVRNLNPAYAAAEMIWYLSGDQHIDRILPYAKQYERFANDGIAHGAYGYRWKKDRNFLAEKEYTGIPSKSQIEAIIDLLAVKQTTRQAVMTMWNAGDLLHAIVGDYKDLPCTLSLNFLVRANKLYMTTTMRSNDIWLGLPYDIFCFTSLQIIIASALNLGLGWYQHQAMSMHVYDRNLEKCKLAANPPEFKCGPMDYSLESTGASIFQRIRSLVQTEEHNQRFATVSKVANLGGEFSLFENLSCMAAYRWCPDRAYERVSTKLLQEYMHVNS